MNQRYSPLTQITPANVRTLQQQWIWQAQARSRSSRRPRSSWTASCTPCRRPTTSSRSTRRPGAPFWTFTYTTRAGGAPLLRPRQPRRGDAGRHALHGHASTRTCIAIDAKTGQPLWNDAGGQGRRERYSITHSADDRQGQGDRRHGRRRRGRSAASSRPSTPRPARRRGASTRFPARASPATTTWSGDSWKTGGVGVWNSGAYDPTTNLVYCGTGNPAPDWDGRQRLGDNLYSDSVRGARRRHRRAEVALPVHAARRTGLRRHAGAGAGGHPAGRAGRAR